MFDTQFEAILADTKKSRTIHYNIRYKVFCQETGYEDPEAFPNAEEMDEYDGGAAHFLVRNRATRDWVGAMRFVVARDGKLPIQSICHDLDEQLVADVDHSQVGEISRLCMLEKFRRGKHKAHPVPEIFLGLLRAILTWAPEHGQRYCYFLVSPGLARVVNRLGLNFTRAGGRCEHRGTRVPYFADMTESRVLLEESGTQAIKAMFTRPVPAYANYSQLAESQPLAIAASR